MDEFAYFIYQNFTKKKKKTTINANIVDRCKSMPADWGG
jgi:hypothetical protein